MTWIITPEILKSSKNWYITQFVSENQLTNDLIIKTSSNRDFAEARQDLKRSLKINGRYVTDARGKIFLDAHGKILTPGDSNAALEQHVNFDFDLSPARPGKKIKESIANSSLSNFELEQIMEHEFPGDIQGKSLARIFLSYYTQGALDLAIQPLGLDITKIDMTQYNSSVIIGDMPQRPNDPNSRNETNVYFKDGNVYLESHLKAYKVDHNGNSSLLVDGSKWTFQIVEGGFKFIKAEVHNKLIYDIFMGTRYPENLESFPAYPLKSRIRNAFHEIFNPQGYEGRDVAAFFGVKFSAKDTYNQTLEKIELPFAVVLSIPKNIIKLFSEFFPLIVEKAAQMVIQKSADYFGNALLRNAAQVVPALIFALAWTVRQIGSRLTSPVASLKKAYAFGAKYHRGLGVALAGLSAIITLGTLVATGAAASAALASAGMPFLASAISWLTPHMTTLGSFLASTCVKAAAAVGISISTGSASLLAGSIVMAFIISTAITFRSMLKKGLSSFFDWNNNANQEIEADNDIAAVKQQLDFEPKPYYKK
jgi:hypothetical protein